VKEAFRKKYLQKPTDKKYIYKLEQKIRNKTIPIYVISLEDGIELDAISDEGR
jgi:hypothetical protein